MGKCSIKCVSYMYIWKKRSTYNKMSQNEQIQKNKIHLKFKNLTE